MADPLPPPRSPGAKWHGERSDPTQRKPASNRGRRLFLLSALALAIVGTVLAIVLYPNRMVAPRFVSMTVREYDSPFYPPNAWALQDGQRIAGTDRFRSEHEDNYAKQYSEQFDRFLGRMSAWNEGPLVVYLTALARVVDDEVIVLLGDTPPEQPRRGVPLKKVLDAMQGKGTGDRLLILDLAKPMADARLGVLSDDVATAIHKELEQTSRPFFILASCSPGQVSHVSEELEASVFAYQIDLALRGFAERKGDRRIDVGELAEYVRKNVDRWVWANRGLRQEPRLYGSAAEFPLVQLGSELPSAPEAPKERTYPAWLKAGWKDRDAALADGSYRMAPWKLRELEVSLQRAEKRWRAGFDEDGRIATEVSRTAANAKEAIKKANESTGPKAFSLAEMRTPKTDELVREYQAKFDRYLGRVSEPGAKAEEGDKARLEELKKIRADLIEELKKLPYESAAAVVVAAAVRPPNLTPGRILASVELLGDVRSNAFSERKFAETVFLERLKDDVERVLENGDWPGTVAHQALQLEVNAENVFAELGRTPSGFDPWNKSLVTSAEKSRQAGDLDVFTGLDFSWRDAQSAYQRAEQLFRPVPLRLDILRQMEEQRDRAFLHLAGWAPYAVAVPRFESQEDSAWRGGVQSARELADLLQAKDPITLDGEPTSLIQWQSHANQWNKAIDVRLARLARLGDQGKAPEYVEYQSLLESPRLTADKREALWTAARRLGLTLTQAMPAPGSTDAEFVAAGVVPGEDLTARFEADRRSRRIRITDDLLDLAGFRMPTPEKTDPKDRPDEATILQDALARGVPDRFLALAKTKDALAGPLEKADRLSRVFPDDIAKRLGGSDFNSAFRNPTRSLHQLRQAAYWSFLQNRYQTEAKTLRERKSRHEVFYAEAADAYARALP